VLDDHRLLALHTSRGIAVMAAMVTIALVAARRAEAVPGLLAGTAVGVVDVFLLSRSLSRFSSGTGLNARALGVGVFTRFVSIGILLGLVLCIRGLNPLAALIGFLFMPVAIAVTGVRALRREQRTVGNEVINAARH
jgi:hypothetical protein